MVAAAPTGPHNSIAKKTMIQRVAQGVSARLFAFTREVKLIALSLATPSV